MRLDRRCAWAFLAGLVLLFGCGGGGGGASTPAATAPSITTQPTSLTVNAGAAATFTVAASGTAPLGYQWKKDGTALSGVSAASYAVAAAQSGDAGSYTVVVTNSAGSATSSAATLSVTTPPSITTQPTSLTVNAGAAATFTVVANGTAPLAYQWKKDGTVLSGATTASYSIAAAQAGDAGSYTVVVTNSAGSATSSAATLSVTTPPSITTQPTSLTVNAGAAATFTVVANGTAPLAYQWKKDGAVLSGATTSAYAIAAAQASDAGSYSVIVSNAAGNVTSSAATLTVNLPPTITTQPVSQSANEGGWVDFSVVASGTAPFTYQWKKEGVSLSGATSATYRILNLQAGNEGRYKVVVTNAVGSVTSNEAILSLGLGITAPARQLLQVTKPATISSIVTGGVAPLTFVWTKDGTVIPGATTRTLSIPFLRLSDQGAYQVQVTDGSGLVGMATSKLFVETTADLGNALNPSSVAMSGSDLYLASPEQNVVYRVNGETGASLPIQAPGGPTTLAVDDLGNVWVTLYNAGRVGRIDKTTGDLTTYAAGNGPFGIAKGLGGVMWFSLKGAERIGSIPTSGGPVSLYSLGSGASPAGLCVQADGTVWVTEPGNHSIGKLAAGASTVVEWSCPHPLASPQQILATQDGQVYYTDLNDSAVVVLAASRQVDALRSLQGAVAIPVDPYGGPMGLLMDGSDQIWLTQRKLGKVTRLASGLLTQANQVARGGGRRVSVEYPAVASNLGKSYSFPSSLSTPMGITLGPNGTIYAALSGTNQVAQVPTGAQGIQVEINAHEPHRVLRGESQTFTATVTGASDAAVTWEILEGTTGGSITQAGVYTAPMTTGNFHIIARSLEDPSKFGRLQVVIFPWSEWPQGRVGILAGNVDGIGNMDGQGSAARFNRPVAVASDPSGTIYVADSDNLVVRMVTAAGVVTTIAGSSGQSGSADGFGSAARFSALNAVAADAHGNVILGDRALLRVVGPDGLVTTLAGASGSEGSTDGPGAQARFGFISAVAVDANSNIYVADSGNYTIRKVTPAGVVSTLAGSPGQVGSTDGQGSVARFSLLLGIAVDTTGNVYVADNGNYTVRKITADGLVSTLAGTPGQRDIVNGTGAAARFAFPIGVTTDPAGNIFVSDNGIIRKITSLGVVSAFAGEGSGAQDGTGLAASFGGPQGLGSDAAGNIYVADAGNCAIRKITPSAVVTTLAGLPGIPGITNGPAGTSLLFDPRGLIVDGAGNVLVADYGNSIIRKITPTGVVSTYAGRTDGGGSTDGPADQARFSEPMGLALDSSGNLFVADSRNSTVRKITPTGVVSTLAGSAGVTGTADGLGNAARFNWPQSLVTDGAGNVYVADSYNGSIRKITPSGVVTTFAGKTGEWGYLDGPAADARFGVPNALAIDKAGNIYVMDYWHASLRKITPDGTVSTMTGSEWLSNPLDGAPDLVGFNHPVGLSVDADGNLYVADRDNNAIRKVLPGGFVGTLVGDYEMGINRAGLMRDGSDMPLGGTYGAVAAPKGVAVGQDGALYVTAGNGVMKLGNNRTDPPPGNLAYRTNPVVYTKGVASTPNLPSNTGGLLLTYDVTPSFPAGLSLNRGTGSISGTPTALSTTAQDYTITGTAIGGQTAVKLTITVNDQPPSNLAYPLNPAAYTKGVAITANRPTNAGGVALSYAISPSLPAGLSFDTATGIITGLPTTLTVSATYTVTATNSGGSGSVDLVLSVNDVPPSNLTYSSNPAAYTKGTTITPNTPQVAGGPVVLYAVTPALPAGLTLDTTTGILSGKPTVLAASAVYTITATNTGGHATVLLTLAVNDVPPSTLIYPTNPASYTKGTAISPNAPTVAGGPVVSYAVSPVLPAGLSLSTTTGILSGTPTALAPQADYTVTATNSGGSATVPLSLTVKDVPPSISFGSSNFTFTTNVPITTLTPANSGGPVVTWAIQPTLPAGLTFSISTGALSGTPTAISPAAAYTVTATNSGGSSSVAPSLKVNPPAPTITAQPADKIVAIGQTTMFSVTATGTGDLTYQWLRDAVAITGATSASYTTAAAVLADQAASFKATATDTYGGTVTSASAVLTVLQGAFTATGPLAAARSGHTATLLLSGKVLVTGGTGSSGALASAEIFDPTAGTFTTTGAMTQARIGHSATLLDTGKVLVAGGSALTAELYDPATGTFTATGSLVVARSGHTATLLTSGKVLLAGGLVASAELFDPTTGIFAATGPMAGARSGHTATRLSSGKVLVAGGAGATVELYDPTGGGTFTATGPMAAPRISHTASLLASGKVLLVGGASSTAELYDPTLGTFAATGSLASSRTGHAVAPLVSVKVLATGGPGSTAEVFEPSTGTFRVTGAMVAARSGHTSTLLNTGKVLVVGGTGSGAPLASAELYDAQEAASGTIAVLP